MAHLSIEYSNNLDDQVDMSEFCEVARKIMVKTKVFPLAGIRVRAFRADHTAIGDGGQDLAFADLTLRMGQGRSLELRQNVLQELYNTLADWCAGQVSIPFALSLEILEIDPAFSKKNLNTIRPALTARGALNV